MNLNSRWSCAFLSRYKDREDDGVDNVIADDGKSIYPHLGGDWGRNERLRFEDTSYLSHGYSVIGKLLIDSGVEIEGDYKSDASTNVIIPRNYLDRSPDRPRYFLARDA